MSRTDRLGDLLLTLPLGNFLRKHLPEVEPVFLVSEYAAPLLQAHDPPFAYSVWEHRPSLRGYQAIVHVFPRPTLAWQAAWARIPRRVGTSRRWYHWLTCTDLPRVARRHSGLHEALLNFRLLAPLLPSPLREKAQTLSWEELLAYRARLRSVAPLPQAVERALAPYSFLIGLHVGGAGGAPRWPLSHWKALAEALAAHFPQVGLVLTGSPQEKPLVQALLQAAPALPWVPLAGQLSLAELVTVLARLKILIAGSTGPLHIAAALGVAVVGLFPAGFSTGPWRWRPLTATSQILGGASLCLRCPGEGCRCLQAISPAEVLVAVEKLLPMHANPTG
ncbi:MAG: glycosyltransferase family 9 protein [Thermaceae bacterium]|nr:glycosyltransferase family 9 protein [Thermaceae bacterium]